MLYCNFLLAIYFTHDNEYISMLLSQIVLLLLPPLCPQAHSLGRTTYSESDDVFQGPKGIALRPCPLPSPHSYPTRTPGVGMLTHSVLCDSAIPWTVAHQALLSMGFSSQEYWSRLPFPTGESSRPRDRTHVSCVSCIDRRVPFHCTTWETPGPQEA